MFNRMDWDDIADTQYSLPQRAQILCKCLQRVRKESGKSQERVRKESGKSQERVRKESGKSQERATYNVVRIFSLFKHSINSKLTKCHKLHSVCKIATDAFLLYRKIFDADADGSVDVGHDLWCHFRQHTTRQKSKIIEFQLRLETL